MNTRFRFRLEAALQQRLRQEQEVQVTLARTMQARGQVLEGIERMERQLAGERRAGEPRGPLDMESRMRLLFYLDRSEGQIQSQRTLLAQWDQEVARVQAILLQASSRRRALERLRERRREEHTLEVRRQTDRELDEHVTMRSKTQQE